MKKCREGRLKYEWKDEKINEMMKQMMNKWIKLWTDE